MKAASVALFVTLTLHLSAAEVRLGDTLNDLGAVMGAPRGQLRVGERQVLYYDRGEIELRAGTVSRVALLSVDEFAALEARHAAIAARFRQEQEIRRGQMKARGEEILAAKLADPRFRATPLRYQVSFWEDFARRYPDVPSAEPLISARLLFAEQLEANRAKAEQAEYVAQLEFRAREAEARVAEVEARDDRSHNFAYYGGYARYSPHFRSAEYNYSGRPHADVRPSERHQAWPNCGESDFVRVKGRNGVDRDSSRNAHNGTVWPGRESSACLKRDGRPQHEDGSFGAQGPAYSNEVHFRINRGGFEVKNFPYALTGRY